MHAMQHVVVHTIAKESGSRNRGRAAAEGQDPKAGKGKMQSIKPQRSTVAGLQARAQVGRRHGQRRKEGDKREQGQNKMLFQH